MKLLSLIGLTTVLLFTACEDKSSIPSTTVTFTPNSAINTQNPDRGFYDANYELAEDEDENIFEDAADNGYKLVYGVIFLKDYAETETLPSSLLKTINNNFNDAKELGIKIILRIKYRDSGDADPSKEIVQAHLKQLKPTLQNNKDIISVVQLGVIGRWGEWHGFSGDYEDDNPDYKDNRREVVETLAEIFPDKYLQIRYPMAKELLYGSALRKNDISDDGLITKSIAFTDDIRAKLGHHNDCFLASDTDYGTYSNDDGDDGIDFWRDYVINDTKYSPVGGETCIDNDTYTNCDNALEELELFGWSYINESYNLDVLQRWKDEGCYQEIKENLGYKLVATQLKIEQDKSNLITTLSIQNGGYSAHYIKSDVSYVLQDANNTYEYTQDVDLRTFYSGETNKIKHSFNVANIQSGTYCLYLKIGEDYSAIRLANSNMWDEESKMNKLTCSITVE